MIEQTLDQALNRLRFTWDNYTDREKRVLLALGAVLLVFLFTLPLFLMIRANSALADSNQEILTLLETLGLQRERLIQAGNEKRLAERRYEQQTPPLGGFLETLAREQGLTITEVTDQPEKAMGQYLRRNVQISMPNVELSPVINLLSAIESSRYPVAIDQLQIDHYRPGNSYNVKLGVITYDKEGARPAKPIGSTSSDEPGATAEEEIQ
ncbi:MAG: type II secretion system protein M [Deltaproteobacteria bacterium]|nr:type II secretion system protein M [Deltaproteobacteria bacterium]